MRRYKSQAPVERALRWIKTMDLKVRPIHRRGESRVRAHIFLCMLAYCVERHMREAWLAVMFADAEQESNATRAPIAPAQRSDPAKHKRATHIQPEGFLPVHSWRTQWQELVTVARNTCRALSAGPDALRFEITTQANSTQQRALDLLQDRQNPNTGFLLSS